MQKELVRLKEVLFSLIIEVWFLRFYGCVRMGEIVWGKVEVIEDVEKQEQVLVGVLLVVLIFVVLVFIV